MYKVTKKNKLLVLLMLCLQPISMLCMNNKAVHKQQQDQDIECRCDRDGCVTFSTIAGAATVCMFPNLTGPVAGLLLGIHTGHDIIKNAEEIRSIEALCMVEGDEKKRKRD